MEGALTMSGKERDRLKVMEAVRENRLKQTEAALQLGLSVQRVDRLLTSSSRGRRVLLDITTPS